MKQTTAIKQLNEESKRLKQELAIAQTINRMHGDSRPIPFLNNTQYQLKADSRVFL